MNKKIKILTIMLVLVSAFGILFYTNTNAQNTQVNLSILAGTGRYNVSSSITLPSRTGGFLAISKDVSSGTFAANSFVVEDLNGSQTWNLQVISTDLQSTNGTIHSGNIFMRVNPAMSITGDVACGVTNPIAATWTGLNVPGRILLTRSNSNGKVCKVAVTPTIGVDIPSNQEVGSYTGTLNIIAAGVAYNGTLSY